MKKRYFPIMILIAGLSTLSFAAGGKVTLLSKSYKEIVVKSENGKKRTQLIDTKKVLPGDIIVYKNTVDNATAKPVKNMVINNPIPKEVTYISGSAKCETPCKILYSVDHGKHFDLPKKLKIKTAGGERTARPDEYTDIRWILEKPLPAHRKTVVSYKAKLR